MSKGVSSMHSENLQLFVTEKDLDESAAWRRQRKGWPVKSEERSSSLEIFLRESSCDGVSLESLTEDSCCSGVKCQAAI